MDSDRTMAQEIAAFAARASFQDLSPQARDHLKLRVLDSLACAFGALDGEPILKLREHIRDFDGADHCALIGGGRAAPDRAALYNGALVRYLDFNDTYLAEAEACHPSDNLGAVLAAAEYARASGADFLAALAVAYQIQCRLSDAAPVRARGFDHTTQGSFAAAAGVSRALGLDEERAASAIAVAGTAFNALRVTRTGRLSHWKGLAYPNTAFSATHAAFLAMRGITGPLEVFEGNKGFMDSISGPFSIDWGSEDLERVTRTVLKRFNAEIHSQSAVEAALELRAEHGLTRVDIERVERVDVETFAAGYNIIGGGEEGDKTAVSTKEQADHSLPYMVAAALLDGALMPEQYLPARITRSDVQGLLRRVYVRPEDAFTARFPGEMPARITITFGDGRVLVKETRDYLGFHTRPMDWDMVSEKFDHLAGARVDRARRSRILQAVKGLEHIPVRDFLALLANPIALAA